MCHLSASALEAVTEKTDGAGGNGRIGELPPPVGGGVTCLELRSMLRSALTLDIAYRAYNLFLLALGIGWLAMWLA